MRIQVKLFAVAKQLAGSPTATVELAPPATIADVRRELAARHPALADVLDSVVFAVNTEYANDKTAIGETDEVACIPPVSGGS